MQLVWSLARPTFRSFNRLYRIKHTGKHLRIVKISRCLPHRERDALPADHNVALRARFAAIRRILPGFTAPFGAGTEKESIQARLQSILSESPSLSNSSWWSLRHIPLRCQCLSLRQQVSPEPQPISGGSVLQGMPLLSTKMMPRKASRLEKGGRPPFGLGRSSGSRGWMISHNSSVTNGYVKAIDFIKHQCARFSNALALLTS